ncbi:MAG: DNA polymerase I [Bacteroidetes bacterium MED-G21]|nr:MAG: DNA polymerase I [Bacteroidetes bacterium MED-G21]
MTPLVDKKLFLFDAFALIYRAYFAFAKNPRINSKGQDTSAVLGLVNTLMDVQMKEQPTHWAICFDTSEPTERHIEYKEYKAQREAMPEGISSALPYIFKLMEALNIPVIAKPGFEADDVIGTLAKKAEKEGFVTYMMTPDKDFAQLVSDNIYMYRPPRMGNGAEIWGIPEVLKKFEINRIDQVIDYLGMMGDASDNIPGIPGVGDKTAKKLLALYDNMDGLYLHTHELKGKQKEKVEANKDLAFLSKKLATINTSVPVEFNSDDLVRKEMNKDAVLDLFEELEFRRLAERWFGKDLPNPTGGGESSAKIKPSKTGQIDLFAAEENGGQKSLFESSYETIETTKVNYELVDNISDCYSLVEKLMVLKSFAFDTETSSLNALEAEIVGMSFCYKAKEAYYVPTPTNTKERDEILAVFKPLFENERIEKVGQNIKFDYHILANYGIELKGRLFDTMIAHYLIQADMRHNMTVLAETYLNYSPIKIESIIGKGKAQLNMRDLPAIKIKKYACEDADITWQLKTVFEPLLKKEDLISLFREIEMPLVSVLAKMERQGINLDREGLKVFSKELESFVKDVQVEIFNVAGTEFNISSPKQLGEVLFDYLKIDDKAKKTKTGQYSTSEEVLSKLKKKHPIVEKVLTFRSLQKLRSTYVDALPGLINTNTQRIHTSFNQAVAATGRLSSNNPNLQNIPIRTERGREVRKAFIPRDDNHVLLAADYSQVELRLIAEMSKDPVMVEAFQQGLDIHAATASKVFNVPLKDVTREMRSNAKIVNFGIIYGVSAFGLSQQSSLSRKEAAEIIKNYFATYPKLKEYMDANIAFAREHGYVKTIMNRKRRLKDINSRNAVVRGHAERNAINTPIQGSAADIIKLAMIKIQTEIDVLGLQSKMLLQVHDELVFDVLKTELPVLKKLIKEKMEGVLDSIVPLVVDLDVGKSWLEAH